MDSKLIFISGNTYLSKVNWVNQGESEWTYFGAGEDVKLPFVMELINKFLLSESLYVIHTRNESFEVLKCNLPTHLFPLLGYKDFSIWNSHFSDVINFTKIGVLRYGRVCS